MLSSPILPQEYENPPKGLSVKTLSLGYHGEAITYPLDFFLPLGHSLSIMGPNGGGKSTLLRTLAGLQEPFQGSFHIVSQEGSSFSSAKEFLPTSSSDPTKPSSSFHHVDSLAHSSPFLSSAHVVKKETVQENSGENVKDFFPSSPSTSGNIDPSFTCSSSTSKNIDSSSPSSFLSSSCEAFLNSRSSVDASVEPSSCNSFTPSPKNKKSQGFFSSLWPKKIHKPFIAYFPQQFLGSLSFPLRSKAVVAMGKGFSGFSSFLTPFAFFQNLRKKYLSFYTKDSIYGEKTFDSLLEEILELFSLKVIENAPIGSLSPGQFQRVLLARFYLYILHYKCPLILMDEPFANIDEETTGHLLRIFLSLLPQGHMLLMSHHSTQRALDFFPTTLLLSRNFHLFGHSHQVLKPLHWEEAHRHPPHSCC